MKASATSCGSIIRSTKSTGPQIELQAIREATDADQSDGYDPLQFVPKSRHDSDQMFSELRDLARIGIVDEPLRNLVLLILDRNADRLRWLPGSHNKYYPFAGGWLEHTLNVRHTCLYFADKYRIHSRNWSRRSTAIFCWPGPCCTTLAGPRNWTA